MEVETAKTHKEMVIEAISVGYTNAKDISTYVNSTYGANWPEDKKWKSNYPSVVVSQIIRTTKEVEAESRGKYKLSDSYLTREKS